MKKYDLTTPAAIRNAAELSRTAAGREPNQSGYNAAWLHGYARALQEVAAQLEPTQDEQPPIYYNLVCTIGCRAGQMDAAGYIVLPSGSDGEDILADFAAKTARAYQKSAEDICFDEFIETALLDRFPKDEQTAAI